MANLYNTVLGMNDAMIYFREATDSWVSYRILWNGIYLDFSKKYENLYTEVVRSLAPRAFAHKFSTASRKIHQWYWLHVTIFSWRKHIWEVALAYIPVFFSVGLLLSFNFCNRQPGTWLTGSFHIFYCDTEERTHHMALKDEGSNRWFHCRSSWNCPRLPTWPVENKDANWNRFSR